MENPLYDEVLGKWEYCISLLDFAFQPIVNIHTGNCYGYEALMRKVKKAGFPSVETLFDQASADGCLYQVELMLREQCIKKFKQVPQHHNIKLFYNLDNRVVNRNLLNPDDTLKLLDRYNLKPELVCFEISEKREFQFSSDVLKMLNTHRDFGFKVAVDDFGTGFSGLQMFYLTEPEFLKIDRFFIKDIANDSKKKIFVSNIINIARSLGCLVIAEGVETEKEFYSCRDVGCDLVQGFLVQSPKRDTSELKTQYEHIFRYSIDRRNSSADRRFFHSEMKYVQAIQEEQDILEVFDAFRFNKRYTFIPILNSLGEPIGLIREQDLKEYTYSRYGRDLLRNPATGKSLKDFITKSPVADINLPAEKILEMFTINEDVEGILMVDDMKYIGFLSSSSLLKVLNEKNLLVAREQNPLSKLPGNILIHEYVSHAVEETLTNYALIYFDFDNFKPFNDKYGFRQGDRVILLFADLLRQRNTNSGYFIGHIGGDDFFMGVEGLSIEEAIEETTKLAQQYKEDVESFYDTEAIHNGFITSKDREGKTRKFDLLTVSAVVLELPAHRELYTTEVISSVLADLKKDAKHAVNGICVKTLNE